MLVAPCRWKDLKKGGQNPSINPVPDDEKGDEDDVVGRTISKAKAEAAKPDDGKKEDNGGEFGTQGKGFGLGMQEWKKNHPKKDWV